MTPSPQDILKLRAQLVGQNQNLPQVQVEQPPVASPSGTGNPNELPFALQNTIQASQSTPQPISPREEALSSYRQAMQQQAPQAPSQADYQPSIGRRIIGGLLGAGVGLSNPQAGGQLASNIISSPYNKALGAYNTQMTDYQKKLAQKKEAYETEAGAELGESKIQEQLAQKNAEVARAGAEEARQKGEEYKISPEGQAAKLAQLKVTHPNAPPVNEQIELKNGETIIAHEDKDGQYKDAAGHVYGPDAIAHVYKIGTEPKETAPKPPRGGESGYIDQWTKEHGREPNAAERLQIHKEYDQSGRKETVVDPEAAGFRRDLQLTTAKNTANKAYQTQFTQASQHLDKIDQAKMLITKETPESLAILIPNILTALISGQGTGVRITQSEMNNIIHARGWGESIEAFGKKISGQGALSTKQKSDLEGILDDVRAKVVTKQKKLSDTMDKIDNASSPSDISKAHVEQRKSELSSGGETKTNPGTETVNSKDPLGILK